jgi:hypothetical protein
MQGILWYCRKGVDLGGGFAGKVLIPPFSLKELVKTLSVNFRGDG